MLSPGIPIFLKLEAGKVCPGGMPFVPSTTESPRATVQFVLWEAQNVLV